ncbi:hypothetical protein LCGC14_0653560, partial [marine sediment metagenome]
MSDDINDYQITPSDLGCGPEPENDPGVVEEAVESGAEKKEVRKSFA